MKAGRSDIVIANVHQSGANILHGADVARGFLASLSLGVVGTTLAAAPAGLEEVVVTATRVEDTVNRVPLSVSAISQDQMVTQGITSIQDLARVVPGLNVTGGIGGSPAISNISIRGVRGTSGAATTGVYMNDTPLQRRFTTSGFQINGTPTPPLFDLQRVEVLRGPQGTLYGGSSLGGTVRFITPAPSLTEYSAYARSEGNHTEYGGDGYEVGAALGGPILEDRMGFRASAYLRRDAGYIDLVDPFNNGALRAKDVNETETTAYQAAFRAAFTERFSGTLSWYKSRIDAESAANDYNLPTGAVEVRAPSFAGRPSIAAPFTIADSGYLSEPFQSFTLYRNPNVTELMVPSLTFVYEGDRFDLQSTTSYIEDDSASETFDFTFAHRQTGVTVAPNGSTTTIGIPYNPYITTLLPFRTHSFREGWSQEFRLTAADLGPWSLVAGLYGATFDLTTHAYEMGTFDPYFMPTIGVPGSVIFGPTYFVDTPFGFGPLAAGQTNNVQDDEIAIYGEAIYAVSANLNLIGGIRVSRVKTSYDYVVEGQLLGGVPPTVANGGIGGGVQEDTPVTPKVQVQYQFTEDRMVYALAAKAFRAGGSNQVPIFAVCREGLTSLGLTPADIPRVYDPDEVWSYEIGAKTRITPNIQLNASVFRIDWEDIQTDGGLGCGQSPTLNAGKAVSQGVDLELNAAFGPVTANLAVGYNDAHYAENAFGLVPSNPAVQQPLVAREGDRIPVPVWNGTLGINYGFNITGNASGYVRGDYQYLGAYENSPRPGSSAYTPDIRITPAAQQTSVRLGVIVGQFEVSLFANNVFNDRDALSRDPVNRIGGRSICSIPTGASCSSYTTYNPFFTQTTFRPRTYGLQAIFRL